MKKYAQLIHNGQPIQIEIAEGVDLWTSRAEHPLPLNEDDYSSAVYQALQHPLDYPPISGGIVPGDEVAIVIDTEVPNPAHAIAGVLRAVTPCDPSRIDVVIAESASVETLAAIRDSLPAEIELTIHSGKSRDDLRYLAANEAANPIYLNRRIVDADLVIPICVARHADPLNATSTASAVFPSLADYRSQARVRLDEASITSVLKRRRQAAAEDESNRVGWLLGLQWLVSVEVADDGQPSGVFVGTPESATARAHESETNMDVPFLADVVIACIDGGAQQQSLTNLLRAALVARRYASTDASIVLICDIQEIGAVIDVEERYDESDDDDADDDQESQPLILSSTDHARKLLQVLINDADTSHRYLLFSNCSEEESESFGFGVVKDAQGLSRLVNGHESCAVIRNAQLALAHVSPARV